jgi:acyl dehydratase
MRVFRLQQFSRYCPAHRTFSQTAVRLNGLGKFEITGNLSQCLTKSEVGLYASVKHVFSQEDVNTFTNLCGDNNPIHTNPEYAKEKSIFGGTIVHGIFVSSLFSTLFGRLLTGAIYVNQSLNFKKPIHVGKPVVATVKVLSVISRGGKGDIIECQTIVTWHDGTVAVEGTAKVLLPKK